MTKLEQIREWAVTDIMQREWPLGDGTAAMLELRKELLALIGDEMPIDSVAGLNAYIQKRYGSTPALGA